MKLLLFGMLATEINKTCIEIEPVKDVGMLRRWMRDKFPAIASNCYMIAVNRCKADDATLLRETDEIALLPPFAGG